MAGLVPLNKNSRLRPNGWNGFYNMLDDFFNDTWLPARSLVNDTFKVDIVDTGKEYAIEAELPGVKKEEVSASFNDGRLTIGVKRAENKEEKKKNYIHKERRYSSMERSVYLVDAKAEGITAKMEDGVLHVTVPKQEKADNAHSIDVE